MLLTQHPEGVVSSAYFSMHFEPDNKTKIKTLLMNTKELLQNWNTTADDSLWITLGIPATYYYSLLNNKYINIDTTRDSILLTAISIASKHSTYIQNNEKGILLIPSSKGLSISRDYSEKEIETLSSIVTIGVGQSA